jgi:Kdo2-lipid IVA lauroyltransferase/acyltransferase
MVKIKIIITILNIIPVTIRRIFVVAVARIFYYLLLRQRLIAVHNLMRSFPEKTLNEILKIAKASYSSFALMAAEFTGILRLKKNNLHRWISIEGLDHYKEACREGNGVLLFSAHFGNWEIGSTALAIMTKPLVFIVRLLDSPFLEDLSTYVRGHCGNISLHKEKAMRQVLRLLKNGETIKLLIDQNVAWYQGVFVDFFGHPACATNGLALLALRTQAPVLPMFTTRMPGGKYLIEIGPKVETVNTGNRDADILVNTQNYAKIIEGHIRKYPGQWLWLHQRWKTKLCQAKRMNSDAGKYKKTAATRN